MCRCNLQKVSFLLEDIRVEYVLHDLRNSFFAFKYREALQRGVGGIFAMASGTMGTSTNHPQD